MTRTEKAKFILLEEKIKQLEGELKRMTESKDTYYKMSQEKEKEINSVHAALDSLPGLPDKYFVTNSYGNKTELTITARLFSWIATMAFNEKITPKTGELK